MKKYIRKMTGRDAAESHRVATPLELLFDLVFVIAIASAASGLHHALAAHHIGSGLLNFGIAFFAIWWGWINYTWFASAFDNDDAPFRILTMVQMFGAVIMAVGIPDLFADTPDMLVVVIGYAVMRAAMAVQWLRAGLNDPFYRKVCLRSALGISVVQALWIARYFLLPGNTSAALASVFALMLCEMAVPVWAGKTPWHPHHIAERYSLLTIIVLGEGMLGVANTVKSVWALQDGVAQIAFLGTGAIALIFALWWLYFKQPFAALLEKAAKQEQASVGRTTFCFGYLHFFIFAALAAVGVGVSLLGDAFQPSAEHAVTVRYAVRTLSAAVTVYLVGIALLRLLMQGGSRRNYTGLLLAFLSPALAALAIGFGMPAGYAVWLALISPVLMILNEGGPEAH